MASPAGAVRGNVGILDRLIEMRYLYRSCSDWVQSCRQVLQ